MRRNLLGIPVALVILVGTTAPTAQAGISDIQAGVGSSACASRPYTATATPGSNPIRATREWAFGLTSNLAVTSATTVVDSGYPAHRLLLPPIAFCTGGAPLSSLPVTYSGLNCCQILDSTLAITQAPGFDSTARATPLKIPTGGAQQTETATFKLTNPALAGLLKLSILSNVPGASFVSATVSSPGLAGMNVIPEPSGVQFTGNPVLGQVYTFTATLSIPNSNGESFASKPQFMFLLIGQGTVSFTPGPASTETIAVPSLDGGTAGRGAATFSVGGASGSWELGSFPGFILTYAAAPLPSNGPGDTLNDVTVRSP